MKRCTGMNLVKAANKSSEAEPYGGNLRFERKFVYERGYVDDIIERVSLNPYGFKEVFYRRKVNNIYFDDSHHNFYKQNVAGVANRKKLRLRWYGDDTADIKDPSIEIKIKKGEVGDKVTCKFKGTTYNLSEQTAAGIHRSLLTSTSGNLPLQRSLELLHPALINTYERRYFLSFCGRFRITVDFNQEFFNPNDASYAAGKFKINDLVLELKYGLESDTEARQLSQYIDARLSKNSKYVRGMNMLYHREL